MNTTFEPREPKTPAALISKAWNSAHSKVKKNNWHFVGKRSRVSLPEIAPVIKMVVSNGAKGRIQTGETKLYRLGEYTGTLDEIKEFAAFKGISHLTMGCLKIKVAA
jgi:hypothetical protein